MNYEQLYVYLDSRPLEEIRECMNNLAELVQKHTPPNSRSPTLPIVSNSPSNVTDHSTDTQASLRKLQKAQQVWTYQAVWNKFGSESADHLSLSELAQEASGLFTSKEVAQYIVDITGLIDSETKRIDTGDTSSPHTSATAAPNTPSSTSSCRLLDNAMRQSAAPVGSFSPKPSPVMRGVGMTVSGVKRPRENKNAGNRSIWSEAEVAFTYQSICNTCLLDFSLLINVIFFKDAALVAAVRDFKDQGWAAITEFVSDTKSIKQCQQRWNEHLQYTQQGIGKSEWTEPELAELERLVAKHTIEPYWSDGLKCMTREHVDWTAIGKELNRIPHDCNAKWKPIALAKITNAPFTPQDDALIMRREAEWGDKGVGLWAALETEMGRPSRNIRRRWKELFEINP